MVNASRWAQGQLFPTQHGSEFALERWQWPAWTRTLRRVCCQGLWVMRRLGPYVRFSGGSVGFFLGVCAAGFEVFGKGVFSRSRAAAGVCEMRSFFVWAWPPKKCKRTGGTLAAKLFERSGPPVEIGILARFPGPAGRFSGSRILEVVFRLGVAPLKTQARRLDPGRQTF